MADASLYRSAENIIEKITTELKRLNRWTNGPLPPEKFENMGAFGENTMAFEQWIQFILIPRVHQIIAEKDEFPDGSILAAYAIRIFSGDPETSDLHDLLYEFDSLFNEDELERRRFESIDENPDESRNITNLNNTLENLSVGDEQIPSVLYTLIEVLPQFQGEDLESQLQTYDTFLDYLSPSARPVIADMLVKAAAKCSIPESRKRIEDAASSVSSGGRATDPYDHETAMNKLLDDHKKSFLDK